MQYHRHDLESPDLDRAFVCFRCMSFESGYEADIRAHGKDCSVPRHEDDVSKFKYYCFFCDPAPMEFNTSSELVHHIAKTHDERMLPFTCTACGKGFSFLDALLLATVCCYFFRNTYFIFNPTSRFHFLITFRKVP